MRSSTCRSLSTWRYTAEGGERILFDAVLNEHYQPIYNDTRANTIAWLKEHPEINRPKYSVNPGDLMRFISVSEYLERYDV